jgi:hypothetical protein
MKSLTILKTALALCILASGCSDKDSDPNPTPQPEQPKPDQPLGGAETALCGLADFQVASKEESAAFLTGIRDITWVLESRPCFSTGEGSAELAVVFGEPATPDAMSGASEKIFSFNQGNLACNRDFFLQPPRRTAPNPTNPEGNTFQLSKSILLDGRETRVMVWTNSGNQSCRFLPVAIRSGSDGSVDRLWVGSISTTFTDSTDATTTESMLRERFLGSENVMIKL